MNLTNISSLIDSPSRLSTNIGAFFAFFFVIFGLFGNLLIIIAITRKKALRHNLVNIFIVSLQLNDIFNICFNQILVGLSYLYIEWYRNVYICEMFVYSSIICCGSLLWHHALISIHRYLVVVRNQTTSYLNMSPKCYVFLSLLLARLIPIMVLIPALLNRNMTVYVSKTLRCMLGNKSVNQNKLIFLLNIVVPCLIVVICFVRIFTKVRQVSRRINKQKKKTKHRTNSTENFSTNMVTSAHVTTKTTSTYVSSKKAPNINREIQITKMFGVIFVVFLFGYLPYGLIRSMDKNNSLNADIYILLTVLFIVSISISPVIYGMMNTQLKVQCIALLKIIFCCKNVNKNDVKFQKIKNFQTKQFGSHKTKEPVELIDKIDKEDAEQITLRNVQRSASAPNLFNDGHIFLSTDRSTFKLKRNFSVKNNYLALKNNEESNYLNQEKVTKNTLRNSFKKFFTGKEKSVSCDISSETYEKTDLKNFDDGGVYKGP